MVVGSLVSFFFSVSFGVFMCLFVYLVSHFCTVTLGSQLISLSSDVDFLVTRKYIKSTLQLSSSEVSEKRGKKIKEYVLFIKNRFQIQINIHISDKYRTMLKNFSSFGNENNKNITELQSKLPRFITTTKYFEKIKQT